MRRGPCIPKTVWAVLVMASACTLEVSEDEFDSTLFDQSNAPDRMDSSVVEIKSRIDPVIAAARARSRAVRAEQLSFVDPSKLMSNATITTLPIDPGPIPSAESQDCLGMAGADPLGLVQDRFLWCLEDVVTLDYYQLRVVDGVPIQRKIGYVEVTFQAVAVGRIDQRSVRVYLRTSDGSVHINDFNFFDRLVNVPNYRMWIRPECTQDAAFCEATPGPAERSYGEWNSGTDWVWWDIRSPEDQGSGFDKVSFHDWRFRYGGGGGGLLVRGGTTQVHGIRCDSADYFVQSGVQYRNACIFTEVIPHLQMSIGNTPVPNIAEHIRRAQETPNATYPMGQGKNIPGKFTGVSDDRGLHRIPQDLVYTLNRHEAAAACERRGPYQQTGLEPPLPAEGCSCDGYPFANVAEGAANNAWDFSVASVPEEEEDRQGELQSAYYFADRILYGDEFYMDIKD